MTARCVVCGGPFPDGTGCEFCPAVTEPEWPEYAVDEDGPDLTSADLHDEDDDD